MKVLSGKIASAMKLPHSKSAANRLLILASKRKDLIEIKNVPQSDDVLNLINCLKMIGVEISTSDQNTYYVRGAFPQCEKKSDNIIELDVGEGGTTARFLIPLLALGRNRYRLVAQGRLTNRPMNDLYRALIKMDVEIEQESEASFPITVCGPAKVPLEIRVDSTLSSQFVSGMALAFWDCNTEIIPDNLSGSMPYYEMTLNYIRMAQAGERHFSVPVDFSSAGYPLAMGIIEQPIVMENCYDIDWYQADAVLLRIAESIGSRWTVDDNGLSIYPASEKKSFSQDCSQCPDLAPTLAFIASYLEGESVLTGLESLRFKESDRLDEILKLLTLFEVDYHWNGESLVIIGRGPNRKIVKYDPPNDHRMVMSGYLFLKYNGGGEVTSTNSVNKSFPDFFKQMGEC